MPRIIKQSFGLNLKIMRVLGFYPPEDHSYLYKLQAYIPYFAFMIPIPILGIIYFLRTETIDLLQVTDNAIVLAQSVSFIVKIISFIRNGSKVKKCINYFEDSLFAANNEEQRRIVADCIRISRRNSTLYLIAILCGVINWNTKSIFFEGHTLPLDIWLPFNPTEGPVTYCAVYLYLAAGITYLGFAGTLIDPVIGGLAYHAAGQVRIIKDKLQHLSEDICIGKNNPEEKFKIVYAKIKQCVDRHNAILRFVKEFEECFSLAVLSQFATSAFAICFCCFQLSMMQFFNFNALVMVGYISLISTQIYMYCYYGTLMFEESNSLTEAIYMGNWYEYDIKSRKALITIMECSKRPMMATAGKILDLSLETFTVIIRRSFSLLAVLKKFQ